MSTHRHRPGRACVIGIAVAALAVPIGVTAAAPASAASMTKPTTAQRVAASRAAVAKATSVRVRAKGRASGTLGLIAFDLHVGRTACDGQVNLGAHGLARIRKIGGSAWLSGDAKYWATISPTAAALVDKWVAIPPTTPGYQDVFGLCSWPTVLENVFPRRARWADAPGRTVDGVKTVGVRATNGVLTDYLAATGTPYPVLQVLKGGWAKLQEWNAPLTVTPPPDDQVATTPAT